MDMLAYSTRISRAHNIFVHAYVYKRIYNIDRYMYMGYTAISQIYTIAWMPATSSSHSVGHRNSNCRIVNVSFKAQV